MEQLTNETMDKFTEQLLELVDGRRFTLRDIRNHTHMGLAGKQLVSRVLPGNVRQVNLDMGGIVQPFTSYFADASSEPLVNNIQTVRVMYKFTSRSLETQITFLSPDSAWKHGTMLITVEG